MAHFAGKLRAGARVVQVDDADFLSRYEDVAAWLDMQLPVSDSAILSRCRAVFASTVGADESLGWYAETVCSHWVAYAGMSVDAYLRLYEVIENA